MCAMYAMCMMRKRRSASVVRATTDDATIGYAQC